MQLKTYKLSITLAIAMANCISFADTKATVTMRKDDDSRVKKVEGVEGPITAKEVNDAVTELPAAKDSIPLKDPPIAQALPPAMQAKLSVETQQGGASVALDAPPAPKPEPQKAQESGVVAFDFSGVKVPAGKPSGAEGQVTKPVAVVPDEIIEFNKPLFQPNKANVIVLPSPEVRSAKPVDEGGIANPFDVRTASESRKSEDLKFKLGGIIIGDGLPSAVLNGKPISANGTQRVNGFNVVKITRDGVILEYDGMFILIPRGKEVTVTVPR